MAVVNLSATIIANRDATPTVLTEPSISNARMCEAQGYVTAGAADSIASIYRICEVPTNARISQVLLSNGAVTSAAADIGVYRNTKDGGAVVSAAFFGSAVSIASAAFNTDVTNESGTNTVAKQQQELWQAAGLTSDPGGTLDICMTLTAAATASADAGLKVRFAK